MTTYEICLDATGTDTFCWFVRKDGEHAQHVLVVALCSEMTIEDGATIEVNRSR